MNYRSNSNQLINQIQINSSIQLNQLIDQMIMKQVCRFLC